MRARPLLLRTNSGAPTRRSSRCNDRLSIDGRADTEVHLIPGGTHCAINKVDQLNATNTRWLAATLH